MRQYCALSITGLVLVGLLLGALDAPQASASERRWSPEQGPATVPAEPLGSCSWAGRWVTTLRWIRYFPDRAEVVLEQRLSMGLVQDGPTVTGFYGPDNRQLIGIVTGYPLNE